MMRPSSKLPAVYLSWDVVDFRKGINGQAVLVEESLQRGPFSERLSVLRSPARQQFRSTLVLHRRQSGVVSSIGPIGDGKVRLCATVP